MKAITPKPFVCRVRKPERTKFAWPSELCSLWRFHPKCFKRGITPVVAIIVLMLMTVSAAGMAYLTITSYQQQAQSGTQGGIEGIGTSTKTQLKIESVSDGQIYLRNLGQETFSNPSFYVEGQPLNVSGPKDCGSGDICVYTVLESVDCEGDCELSMGADAPVGTSIIIDEEQITAYSITTFSDSSSSKNITFSDSGTDTSVKIEIPLSATISFATIEVKGLSIGTIDSSSNYTIDGENNNNFFTNYMSSGDLNSDGYDDLLVGAMGYSSNTGRAYVFWGDQTPDFDSSNNYTIDGGTNDYWFGSRIFSGDINNDNYPDLLIGVNYYSGGDQRGIVYVFWGNSSGDFSSANNFTIIGEAVGNHFGESISSADMNNDNYDDLLVGAPAYGANDMGRAYIFWGNSTNDFSSADNYTITGEDNEYMGETIFSGDINGDGNPDLLVGARGYSSNKGRAYVFWGNSSGDFFSADNYTLVGDAGGDQFGSEISSGDLNSDGYDDLLVGAVGYSSGSEKGRVYVFWGNSTGKFDSSRNCTLTGETDSDRFGMAYPLSSGDVNSDGYDDVLVGANRYASQTGRAYVFWGNSSGDFSSANNYTITGENTYDRFAVSFSSADMNNDNYDDLLVGAHYYPSNNRKGRAYIFWQNRNYTTSPKLYPGTNLTSSWEYSGFFNTTVTADIIDELNLILPDCDCEGCSITSGNCIIDLNITSQSMGRIQLSNLQIIYT